MSQARNPQNLASIEEARKFHKDSQCQWIFVKQTNSHHMFHSVVIKVAGQVRRVTVGSFHAPQMTESLVIWARPVTLTTITSAEQGCSLETAKGIYLDNYEAVYLQKSRGIPGRLFVRLRSQNRTVNNHPHVLNIPANKITSTNFAEAISLYTPRQDLTSDASVVRLALLLQARDPIWRQSLFELRGDPLGETGVLCSRRLASAVVVFENNGVPLRFEKKKPISRDQEFTVPSETLTAWATLFACRSALSLGPDTLLCTSDESLGKMYGLSLGMDEATIASFPKFMEQLQMKGTGGLDILMKNTLQQTERALLDKTVTVQMQHPRPNEANPLLKGKLMNSFLPTFRLIGPARRSLISEPLANPQSDALLPAGTKRERNSSEEPSDNRGMKRNDRANEATAQGPRSGGLADAGRGSDNGKGKGRADEVHVSPTSYPDCIELISQGYQVQQHHNYFDPRDSIQLQPEQSCIKNGGEINSQNYAAVLVWPHDNAILATECLMDVLRLQAADPQWHDHILSPMSVDESKLNGQMGSSTLAPRLRVQIMHMETRTSGYVPIALPWDRVVERLGLNNLQLRIPEGDESNPLYTTCLIAAFCEEERNTRSLSTRRIARLRAISKMAFNVTLKPQADREPVFRQIWESGFWSLTNDSDKREALCAVMLKEIQAFARSAKFEVIEYKPANFEKPVAFVKGRETRTSQQPNAGRF